MRVRDRQRRAEGIFRLARRILWQAYYNFDKDNGWMMAGHIAYMGLFALFPFLIFLVALAGFLGQGEAANNSVELGLELLPHRRRLGAASPRSTRCAARPMPA